MIKTKLYLFTANFPFGTSETFLETEIIYLAKGFDEVVIISQNITSVEYRRIPDNCSVERIDLVVSRFDKMKALLCIFNPLFWRERKIIKTVYVKKITKGMFSTMLISLFRAKKVKTRVALLKKENQLGVKQFFYSYWCDDVALGLAMAQKENLTISCLSRMHGWDVYFEASNVNYLPFRHFISDHLKAIFAISQKGIDYGLNTWKVKNKSAFQLARLGVEAQDICEINEDQFLLVSCSNVIPLKRVELIVRALSEINDFQIHWVHFGDGPLLEEVIELARNILPSNITYDFKGRVSNQQVLEWYALNNPIAFINVSTTEGVPVSIMEAMSFGIPVIATNVGGTSEIVDSENGVLINHNPTKLEIKSAIEGIRGNSYRRFAAYHTWEFKYNAAHNYLDFVRKIQSA